LAAILFPVFAQAREKARQSSCLSNMKQWGNGFMMYSQDYDETLPSQQFGSNPEVSWVSVIQPYAEKKNISANNNLGGRAGAQIAICPSMGTGKLRNAAGQPTNDFVRLSYGMVSYAVGSRLQPGNYVDPRSFRPIAVFNAPADTILLGEQFLNFNQIVYYPVTQDQNVFETYSWSKRDGSDKRFERIPGIPNSASNLDPRHSNGSNYLFVDGHCKWLRPEQTYRSDGSFSMWTISNTWRPR
jgi:prepilin-type processing-associated H-X9-DG protein